MRTSALFISAALGFAAALLFEDGFGFGFSTAQASYLPAERMTCDEVRKENHILWQILDKPSLYGEVYARR